jgi:hypothetical protein
VKLNYLLSWLAGGGLVLLAAYACRSMMKVCEARHEAESKELWDLLVAPDHA